MRAGTGQCTGPHSSGPVPQTTVFKTDARAERAQGWSRLHAVVTMRHRVLLRHRKVGCLMGKLADGHSYEWNPGEPPLCACAEQPRKAQ